MKKLGFISLLVGLLTLFSGCVAVNTLPTVARAGDTVSVMVGGSESARKGTVAVSLTDANGGVWDLKALGLVRSVFNLRADALAEGMHYSSYLSIYYPWSEGHEPLQTVLVLDLPTGLPAGAANLTINLNVNDDSSGIASPYNVKLDVIAGAGQSDQYKRRDATAGMADVDFESLERAPYVKVDFGVGQSSVIGAASLAIDFDELVLSPEDINVYSPETTVRGSISSQGQFGEHQRMLFWRQDGDKLYADVVSPLGIEQQFLQLYLIYPRGLSGDPQFSLVSATVYDPSGNPMAISPNLTTSP